MKYSFLIILLSIGIFSLLANNPSRKKNKKQTQNHAGLFSNGTDEDPKAADRFAFEKLKDPKTGKIPADIDAKSLAFAKTLPQQDLYARSATQWQSRGPNNLGGRTRALALDVTNENIILAGQATGGMWRSTDGGAHFKETTVSNQLHSVSCVVQDKRVGKTNVWYYGTGEHYGVVNAAGFSSQQSGNGIYKSTDGGQSWNQLMATVSNTPTTMFQKRDFDFVWGMVVDNSNSVQDEVYAATVNGIWRSVDGGNTWAVSLGLDTAVGAISEYTALAITSTGVLYATVSSETPSKGIWRSIDGITWTQIKPAAFPTSFNRTEIGISPSNENIVYFITEAPGTGANGHGLWKYEYVSGNGDGAGGIWTNLTANIPNNHCLGYFAYDFAKFSSQNSYDLYIRVHPTLPDMVFLGGTDIYRDANGFTISNTFDWIGGYNCDSVKHSNYVYPNHHPDQHNMVFYPSNPNKVLSSNDGGIFRTNDITAPTVQWTSLNNWYNTGQFYACAIEPGNTTSPQIVGGLQDNGTMFCTSLDYSQNWYHVLYGDGGYCGITPNRKNYYLSYQQGKVFKFDISDNGTVNNMSRIDPTGGGNYEFISPFILDPTDENRMYLLGGKVIWRNDSLSYIPMTGNEYNTVKTGWKAISQTSTGLSIAAPHIVSLGMSEANTNILYYGLNSGQIYRLDSCKDASPVRVNITSPLFPSGAYLASISVDNSDPNKVLISFSNYSIKSIFYTDNAGASWKNVSGNLEQNMDGSGNGPSVPWVHIYFDGTSSKYFAGTSTGLYSTDVLTDSTTVWSLEGANTIGNVVINMITSRKSDQTVVVATHGAGIYSNKVYNIGVKELNKEEEELAVFPNPFKNSTTLILDAKQNEKGHLSIKNLLGQSVLESEVSLFVGKNQLKIEALDKLIAGEYILVLKTKTEIFEKKIIKE